MIKRYGQLLQLESAFGKSNGLERFYGNHDDLWASPRKVRGHLGDVFGPDAGVREALRLVVDRGDKPAATLFFAHGHQGTPDSDQNRWIARPVVRYIWRPLQRWLGFSMTTPARSYELRAKHDRAMYEWARTHPSRVVLIAGHTHRPVFAHSLPDPPPTRPIDQLVDELERARGAGERTLAGALHAELEFARTNQRRDVRAVELTLPCYFNTGCCSFPDGDVTGLEIADRLIRLVRWPGNLEEIRGAAGGVDPSKRILAEEPLDKVLEKVVDDPPADAKMIEHEIAPV